MMLSFFFNLSTLDMPMCLNLKLVPIDSRELGHVIILAMSLCLVLLFLYHLYITIDMLKIKPDILLCFMFGPVFLIALVLFPGLSVDYVNIF